MKTEHQKLKEIIDTIGYEADFNYDKDGFGNDCEGLGYGVWNYYGFEEADVREIIFTTEFSNKYNDYFWENKKQIRTFDDVIEHLDDPVQYLYDLLNLGKQ